MDLPDALLTLPFQTTGVVKEHADLINAKCSSLRPESQSWLDFVFLLRCNNRRKSQQLPLPQPPKPPHLLISRGKVFLRPS